MHYHYAVRSLPLRSVGYVIAASATVLSFFVTYNVCVSVFTSHTAM